MNWKIKNYLLIILFLFNFPVYAKNCKYNWEVYSLGFHIGNSEDELHVEEDFIWVNSIFQPSEFLKSFKVENIERFIQYDSNLNFLRKREFYLKNKKEYNLQYKSNQIFSDNNLSFEKKHNLTIDSTVFPYIYFLNNKINITNITNVNILTKNKVIYGELFFDKNNFYIKNKDLKLQVFIKEDRQPYKILINKDNQSLTINLKEKICTDGKFLTKTAN